MFTSGKSITASIVDKLVYLLVFITTPAALHAQQGLQSPEAFLGYTLGDHFTPHHKVVAYFKHVSESSPSVQLENYGETYEKRPLTLAFISSPKNIDNLENLRTANLTRTGLLEGQTPDSQVAFVWLSYNVHGNEAVSSEAAMKTLYALANPEEQEKQQWLENVVVIIDPALNPDGRARYINFYNQWGNKDPNANPDSKEHHEPWPGGRANHYLFDLNRDWAWQTQKESQHRMKVYNRWLPQIHVDFHEQGVDEPYYFAPAAEPLHEVITPWQRRFQQIIGEHNAEYFAKNNWLFFTKEVFDLLYPSYGDTYPMYNGAIGMTYEQGGSGRAGLRILTSELDTLTLKERIDHHFTTGLTTIEITSQNVAKLLQEYEIYFKEAVTNPSAKYKTYVIKNEHNPDKIADLKNLLNNLGIDYGTGNSQRNLSGFGYRNNKETKFDLKESDLIISAYQPKSALVQVLFEPETRLQDSVTYDITAWAIPYMFDLDAFATTSRIQVQQVQKAGDLQKEKFITTDKSPYAYISGWSSIQDLKWLCTLLKEGIKVRHATEPFEIENQKYNPGTLIITRAGNEGVVNFDSLIIKTAEASGRALKSVYSGLADSGKDFGSGTVTRIHRPEVAVITGKEVSSLSFGEIWHFFEQDLEYPITLIDTDYFKNINLSKYDVLIIPSGDYKEFLDQKTLNNLRDWVKRGGKLIAIEKALASFVDKDDFGLTKYNTEDEKKKAEERQEKWEKENQISAYKEREKRSISTYTLGGIFKAAVDNSHPLGFGYSRHYFTLKVSDERYAYLKKGWNVASIRNDEAHVSGFVGYKAKQNQIESLLFGVYPSEKGTFIYMVDNPLFRSFWHHGKLLFGNAVFLVGQ